MIGAIDETEGGGGASPSIKTAEGKECLHPVVSLVETAC